MNEYKIYIKLVRSGLTPISACALMGNMKAESGMRPNNVQDSMGYSDEDYTAAVDAGLIDFVNDQRGYGLCQWTYPGRKRNLLAFATERGVSIGDLDMQVDFCIHELRTEYSGLWIWLTTANGLYEATRRICEEFERPAVNNVNIRAKFGNEFYMSLGSIEIPEENEVETDLPNTQLQAPQRETWWPPRVLRYNMYGGDVVALQGLLAAHGFGCGITGVFDNLTLSKLKEFQLYNGLESDGIAGKITFAELTKI